ncbi:hypothetical protein COA01_29885 [Bacillus cereus]|nr:hypothetical protein COA01_29885 [Bacillus cereus]
MNIYGFVFLIALAIIAYWVFKCHEFRKKFWICFLLFMIFFRDLFLAQFSRNSLQYIQKNKGAKKHESKK